MKTLLESWKRFITEAEDMKRVSKAVMINEDGKVLILKRTPDFVTKESPWEWDLPGGHIQKGESDVKGLQREIQEETNLYIRYAPEWFMLEGYTRFYLLRNWEGVINLSHEHTEYKWVDPKEIKGYYIGKMYESAIREASIIK